MEITEDRVDFSENATPGIEIDSVRLDDDKRLMAAQSPETYESNMSWKDAFKSALSNALPSTFRYGKTMVEPLRHPIKTANALSDLAVGVYQKLTPGEQENEQLVDAVVADLRSKYGSIEGFKKYVAEDPAFVLGDVASLLIPAGKGIQGIGTVTKLSKVAKVGKTVAKVGAVMEPMGAAGRIATIPVKLLIGDMPGKLWARGAKMSSKLSQEQRNVIGRTAVANRLTFSIRSLDKTRNMINEMSTKVDTLIDAAVRKGETIPIGKILKDYEALQATVPYKGGTKIRRSQAALARIKKELTEFNTKLQVIADDRGINIVEAAEMTVKEVQEYKKSLYAELQDVYLTASRQPLEKEAAKLLARNAKTAIEEIIPEVKKLNRQEGALIDVYEAIEQTSTQLSKGDLMPVKPAVEAAIGKKVAGVPGAVVGGTLGILDRKAVKSRIAVLLYMLKNRGVDVKPAMARLGIAQLGEYVEEQENDNE
jgi:hypothetical protein